MYIEKISESVKDLASAAPSLSFQDWEAKNRHRYQRVVFSRPDFHWTAPHVPPSFLSMEHIWIMDGQEIGEIGEMVCAELVRSLKSYGIMRS